MTDEPAKSSEQIVYVQLRLPKGRAEALRDAGLAGSPNRTLPGEVLHRIDAYDLNGQGTPATDGKGSPMVDALLVILEEIANDADLLVNTDGKHREAFLGTVKAAFGEVLDHLGAGTPDAITTPILSGSVKRDLLVKKPGEAPKWEKVRAALVKKGK